MVESNSFDVVDKEFYKEIPKIVVPIVGANKDEIIEECKGIVVKQPDLIEWRADFFQHIADVGEVKNMVREIKEIAGDIPIILTIRSVREGGKEVDLDENGILNVLAEVNEQGIVDIIDFELSNQRENLEQLREVTKQKGTKLILSYHNFEYTPSKEFIDDRIIKAKEIGADIFKMAVMPRTNGDVLSLLQITEEAHNKYGIPIISMSMGELGVISRIIGWQFGSVFSFAVGHQQSAPGQIPIEDLREVIKIVKKYQ